MEFDRALTFLKNGAAVRRESWPKGDFIKTDETGKKLILVSPDFIGFPSLVWEAWDEDILASDWVEAKA